MPPVKIQRVPQRAQLQTGTLMDADPDKVSRHLSDLATAVAATDDRVSDRSVVVVDLIVGANTFPHGLGRPARGATLTPRVADATFAWALTTSDTRQATIVVVGVNQPGATLELF